MLLRMETLRITICPTCGSRRIRKVRRDWSRTDAGRSYTVPDLEFFECPGCGEQVFNPQAMRKIEEHSPAFSHRRGRKGRLAADV